MRDVLQAVDVASPNGKPAQLNAHVLLEVSDSRRAVDNVLQHCVKVLTDVRLCHCTFGECGKDEQKCTKTTRSATSQLGRIVLLLLYTFI